MKKIPVGGAISHGFGFAFGGFLNLFRVLWLPAAAASLCSYLVGNQMSVLGQALRSHDYSRLTMPWPLLIVLTVIAFICGNMQIVAAYQLALGKIEARTRWFYFPLLERALWRVIGAFFLLALTMAGLVLSYTLAVLLVGFLFNLGFHAAHMTDAAIKAVSNWDVALAFTAGYCGFIFCMVRFGFLLFPATVAEEKIGLFRAWMLSHGNFWRVFAVSLAAVLPLILAECLLLAALGMFQLPPPDASPERIRALQAAAQAAADVKMHTYWYLFYPAMALMLLLTYGILAGAQAFAYRALTEDADPPLPIS